MTDYKKYSLGQVENFLYDAMSTDATPQEIYDVIKGVVEDNYYTYKQQTANAYELLALLNGNGMGHITMYDDTELDTSFQVSEKSEHFYDYDRNDINKKNPFVDKVKKWVLPVEADGPSGEYFITFPDDLLEAANLKEGDQIEWHDQGDGSYLLKKFERKANTYDEMIAAGYTMTDDGFWIKETK